MKGIFPVTSPDILGPEAQVVRLVLVWRPRALERDRKSERKWKKRLIEGKKKRRGPTVMSSESYWSNYSRLEIKYCDQHYEGYQFLNISLLKATLLQSPSLLTRHQGCPDSQSWHHVPPDLFSSASHPRGQWLVISLGWWLSTLTIIYITLGLFSISLIFITEFAYMLARLPLTEWSSDYDN